jgi:hypothetical protein
MRPESECFRKVAQLKLQTVPGGVDQHHENAKK